jgi:hypothetical protein
VDGRGQLEVQLYYLLRYQYVVYVYLQVSVGGTGQPVLVLGYTKND